MEKITLQGIHKAYLTSSGRTVALQDVNLKVANDEFVALVGPSGCGKSTLLRIISALIRPSRGTASINNAPVLSPSRDVGIVFQQAVLLPWRSVLDNVTMAPRKLKPLGAEQARELGLEQLDRVGLRHKADVRPATLSGGQQQRVAIARALAMSPQVMFFDEATSALDPELVKGILSLIADLGSGGMTMVVVTHEMGFASSTSDAVVFMDHGQVVESGPPQQIFEAAETERLRRFLSQVL